MKCKRILSVLLAVVMAFGIIPFSASAADWGEGDTLESALSELKVGFHDDQLDWLALPGLGVIKQRYTYYMFKNERTGTVEEQPIYCIDPTKGGAYEIVRNVGANPDDGSSTATYIRGDKVGDAKYRNILASGYPHFRYTGLGLQSNEEAYYATKLALWMYIRGNNPSSLTINPAYGDSDPVAKRVREAAISIYNNGVNNGSPVDPKLTLTGKPNSIAKLDAAGEYYVQETEVYASSWIGTNTEVSGDVKLAWASPPPAGTIVLGTNGEDITSSLSVKMSYQSGKAGQYGTVIVKYLAAAVANDEFNAPTLKASAILANDEIYVAYAKVDKDRYQRYLVERDPKIELTADFVSQIYTPEFGPDPETLRIRKVQDGTNIPLEGAVFEIRDPDGRLIYSLTTDASGIIDVPLTVMGNYTITEIVPPQYHLLPEVRTQSVYVRYGETAEVTFTDTPYGALRVRKVDEANGRPLGGATVRIRNIVTNSTQERQTDSSGSAYFDLLPVGAYEIVEITSPDGYALDSSKHTVNVVPLSDGETSYTLTNKAKAGLRIIKFDGQTMTAIEGVTFEVWRDGELYGTYKTNAWGEIELRDLPAGTYTAREVATVEPYVLDTTSQWIELKDGQGYISELIFFNLRKPGMWLVKVDSETFKTLPNVRFKISKVGGTYTNEFTTDINGEIDLSALEPGAYQVQELSAPDGYLIDNGIRTIQLNAGETAQFVFTNTKKPGFELIKLDSKTGLPLPGATFRIARIEDGSHYLDRVTGTDGKIRVDDLLPSVYSVQELTAPEGYVKDETEYHVQLFPGKLSTLVVSNPHKPDLQIIKRDEKTGELLAGASFKVRKADSSTYATVTTDANGEAWLYQLDPGVYEVTETLPPPGYLRNNTPQLITLFPNRIGIVEFTNAKKPGLTILKIDEVTTKPLPGAEFSIKRKDGAVVWEGLTDENGEINLTGLTDDWYTITEILPPPGYIATSEPKDVKFEAGEVLQVKFDNIRKPVLIFLKSNGLTGKGIAGATFKVEYEMPGGGVKPLGSFKSGSDGRIIIPKVEPGWYIFTETMPAQGFSLPSNPVTRLYVSAGANAYLDEFEHFYTGDSGSTNDNGGMTLLANEIEEHSGSEYYTQGEGFNWPLNSIVIKKTHAITGELLSGAAFELYRADEQVSGIPGTNIGRYTTDNSGIIVITGLEPGYYIVKEVQAPANFLISENSQQNGLLKTDGTTVLEFTFVNYPYGSILVSKIDALTGEPLAGAKFKVVDSSGAVLGNTNGEYITDSRGEILIPNVKPDSYVVTEVQAPANYAINTTPQTVKVGTDGRTYKVSFENYPYGGIVLRKLDGATKQPLSGAEFLVTRSDGTVVGTSNGVYVTDANGTITIPNLPKGSYIIKEIKAPNGYVLENNTQTISVEYGKTYTLDVYNNKLSGMQIIKIDSATKKPIKGAVFTVYKKSGDVVGAYTTNGDGVIILDALEPGWYKAVETKAPDGYLLEDIPQDFEITNNEFIKLVFENTAMSGLLIVKTDATTGKPLSGVIFDVRHADGQFVTGNILDGNQPGTENNSPSKTTSENGDVSGSYTTDKNGRIYINGLVAGEYHVIERKAQAGYELDETVHSVTVTPGKLATLQITNKAKAGLRLLKIDAITKEPIYGVEFMVLDAGRNVVGTYYTDNNGLIDFSGILPEGRYTIRETRAAKGYYLDEMPRTIELKSGQVTEIRWENTPQLGQIQIVKRSGDDNEVNGLLAGSPLEGAVFEVYTYKSGNLVDRFISGSDGRAVSKPLPLGRYIIKEVQAPLWYKLSDKVLDVEIEFPTQIVKLEYLNFAANTGVTIRKTGNYEAMPGDTIRYDFKELRNVSTVPLTDYYWRDVLPTDAVRLTKIITGTYNQSLKYKVLITTNKGDQRIIADNLSTTKNNVLDCSNAALGLGADEYVTSFTLVFGTVKAGFSIVEQPQVYVKVNQNLPNGYRFANKADTGGKYGREWVVANTTWTTTIYTKPQPLPRTGY